ncbi:rhomboid family intramembrane serine protease [Pukyongia salina]|uniref:Rhomboid family intramembrane serine protease n=1 Tax=Pukyongia salina TaxID=2094025 RepID=A0A2S0HST1_9FLAO|nr:rhomboid family intramembrane serine protease [Pukyongia salina]AVI49751.1 rhomboid family intramembrane serine protease [Pukyongia salina]
MGRISETIKVLIVVNVIFFAGTLMNQEVAYRLFSLYYFDNPNFQIWQPITHMFMHGGLWHILFNMYALWAFGTPLEMRWGRKKFLFFYFSAGLGAALIHSLVNYYNVSTVSEALIQAGWSPTELANYLAGDNGGSRAVLESVSMDSIERMAESFNIPAVGASGAIYGILVAFAIMFPNIELMLIFLPIPIKAKYFVPGLIVMDLVFGFTGSAMGIAHWAHIGGALFGFIMAWYWKKNSFDNSRLY